MDGRKTNAMMEYFSSGEADNFSLQEMIERDIKSDFEDDLMKGTSGDLDVFSSMPEPLFTLPCEASTESNDLGAASGTDNQKLGDLSWLQTVNLSAIKPENTDPNLLVNPQTGLPNASPAALVISNRAEDAAGVTTLHKRQIVHIKPPASPMSPAPESPRSPAVATVTVSQNVQTVANPTTISIALASPPLQAIQNTQTRQLVSIQSQSSLTSQLLTSNNNKKVARIENGRVNAKVFPKPVYSYSCLIAMALKNSENGALPVSEIYSFMTENFPYFKTAPDGWKNSVRHNLSLNKCFEKIDNPRTNGNSRKGCLWGLNPDKIEKMDEEIAKWRKKDPIAIKRSMAKPEVLDLLEKGNIGSHNLPVRPKQPVQTLPSGVVRVQNINKAAVSPALHINGAVTPAAVSTTLRTVSAAQCASPGGQSMQISAVEITPAEPANSNAFFKQEYLKMEEGLSSDDLAIIDTALNLDPSLTDINMQHSVWDDISADVINFDESAMVSSSGLNMANLTNGLSAPAQAASGGTTSPLISLLTSTPSAGVVAHSVTTTPAMPAIARTISAQT